jgi:probable rRNA maturation factor
MTPRRGAPTNATPHIDVVIQSPHWKARPSSLRIVRRAVKAAAKMASTPPAELAIVLTDDASIRVLNCDWRGQDKPTNVLSFPAKAAPRSTDHSTRHLGDIVIAYQTTAGEAAAESRPFGHHLAHLAVHGFLHLLGYDHENDRDAAEMERLEVKILATLKVPDPYHRSKSRR